MEMSILVVSKTAKLLNRMLNSLADATSINKDNIEILCSWNGDDENEINSYKYKNFNLIKEKPYNFAANMNMLISKSNCNDILIINDDVILDKKSIDYGMKSLNQNDIGIVGGLLRNNQQKISHCGVLFNLLHSPFHQLENLLDINSPLLSNLKINVPAATGALMLTKRKYLNEINFNELYQVCGEDIEICLDFREILNLQIIIDNRFSGIHQAETTRQKIKGQSKNKKDRKRIQKRYKSFLINTSLENLNFEYNANKKLIQWMFNYNIKGLLLKPHNNSIFFILITNFRLIFFIIRRYIHNFKNIKALK